MNCGCCQVAVVRPLVISLLLFTTVRCLPLSLVSSYIGCYKDWWNPRAIVGIQVSMNELTIEKCLFMCGSAGYKYFGVEYKYECYCGNSYDRYGRADNSGCNTYCSGNAEQICGGSYRLSVYSCCPHQDNNQWPESSTSVDSQQDRVLAVTSNIALSDNLPIKALARHPLKVGWVLAATSTALLEISEVGNCWMVSGHVDLNSSACESDGAASHHTLFQEIIYVYPVAEETFSGNLGSSSVLIADSQQHCIYHIDLSTTVTEEFIGNCGSDKITAEFESKNQMDYELRSPLSIRPVRINSQTSLLVTTQYLTLGVTIISFSPGLSAYRSRILEDSVGYTSHPLYLCNAVSSTVNLETTSGQKICSLTQNRLGMLYEFQWECHRTKHMFTLDEESFFQVMDNKIYQLIPDFSSLAYVQKRIYVKNPEGEEVNVMSYGSFGSSVVGVYDQSVHQILLIAQQKEKIDTDTAATYTLSTDEIGCSNYVVYHSFPASAETCAYISYRHVGTGFIYDSTISRCYLVSYLSETYGEGIGSLANLSCYNDVSRV